MSAKRRVKLFRNGRNQAVRIPREFELPGEEEILRKEGERLIIEPASPRSLLVVLAALEPLDEAVPPVPELPTDSPWISDALPAGHERWLGARTSARSVS